MQIVMALLRKAYATVLVAVMLITKMMLLLKYVKNNV